MMAQILEFKPRHQRRIVTMTVNEVNGLFRVYLDPPAPSSELIREFPTSGAAVRYAVRLAIQHHFPIRTYETHPLDWDLLVEETREAL